MAFNSISKALVFNPLTDSVYSQQDVELAQPIPPASDFIITEDGYFIVSESGEKLITE